MTILVYSELALRMGVLESEIQDALISNGMILYPIAPSTTSSVAGSLLLTALVLSKVRWEASGRVVAASPGFAWR